MSIIRVIVIVIIYIWVELICIGSRGSIIRHCSKRWDHWLLFL